jgi:hypothetical protein
MNIESLKFIHGTLEGVVRRLSCSLRLPSVDKINGSMRYRQKKSRKTIRRTSRCYIPGLMMLQAFGEFRPNFPSRVGVSRGVGSRAFNDIHLTNFPNVTICPVR